MRYFLDISYQGTNYHGWQIQKNAVSVQQVLNESLQVYFQRDIKTIGSGRTDTGVHAKQQVVQFDVEKPIDSAIFLQRINKILPPDISANAVYEVNPDASARFDARLREYRYTIIHQKDPFMIGKAMLLYKKPDLNLMNKAAQILKKHTDFKCFSKVKTDVDHFECNIFDAKWEYEGERLIFTISANRFLRGMVRAIVGTMIDVGLKKNTLEDFGEILKSKDRKKAGAAADAQGLVLERVEYNF